MLFSRPSSSGTASVLQPLSGSANRPESLQELPSLFRSKAKHSYSFDELRHQLRLISRAPSGIICGAALTAGHDAVRRTLSGEGTATRNYFKAFRSNFAKSTGYWLIFGTTGALCVYSWIVLQITPLLIPKFALTIVWLIGFEWVWALQARFENSFWRTLGNAFVFGVSNIGHTLALIAIDAVYVALLVASWVYMPQGLFLLLVLGYGTMLMLHSPILEHVFRKYISK